MRARNSKIHDGTMCRTFAGIWNHWTCSLLGSKKSRFSTCLSSCSSVISIYACTFGSAGGSKGVYVTGRAVPICRTAMVCDIFLIYDSMVWEHGVEDEDDHDHDQDDRCKARPVVWNFRIDLGIAMVRQNMGVQSLSPKCWVSEKIDKSDSSLVSTYSCQYAGFPIKKQ